MSKSANTKTATSAAPVVTEEAVETTEVRVEEPSAEQVVSETPEINLVVCAFEGTESLVSGIWQRQIGSAAKIAVMTVSEGQTLSDILAEVVANNLVCDDAVLVPAVCIPCAHVSLAELHTPYVFRTVTGKEHYSNRLPIPVDKSLAAAVLSTIEGDDESVMEAYLTQVGRPVVASFKEGNIVTPVLRGTPCENVVIEALLRKKYIVANPVGFNAIRPLLMKTFFNE